MDSPEKRLQAFLDGLPEWRKNWLQYKGPWDPDLAKASQEEREAMLPQILAWSETIGSSNDEDTALRDQFENLLLQVPERLKEYRNKVKRLFLPDLPHRKSGRKTETALAERIWTLRNEGKTVREIQAIFLAEGKTHSLVAIEAYLKKRRKKPQE